LQIVEKQYRYIKKKEKIMDIKEIVGDFDYMVYRDNTFTLEHDDLGELDENSFAFKRIGVDYYRVFDFSSGIPEGMEFLKKTEPKYDAKKDFERLVNMVLNSGKQIYMESSTSKGLSPIYSVAISREKNDIRFWIDRSRNDEVRTQNSSFSVKRNNSDMKIQFHGNQVLISFKNGYSQTIEFRDPTKVTING
jgi:hypothetical protein